jgi:tetratricopeptide (TPR) repeat protein
MPGSGLIARLAAGALGVALAGCATAGGDPTFPAPVPADQLPVATARPDPAAYVPHGPLVLPTVGSVPPNRAAALRFVERAARDLQEGRDESASRELDRAIRVDPNNAYATFLVALHRHRQGEFDQSLAFARKAEILLRSDPPWLAETYVLMALNHEALARPRDALRLYDAALQIDPDDPVARGRAADLRRTVR